MRITKYLHSCLIVEEKGCRILFDPGFYLLAEGTFSLEHFFDISAVVITHRHRDHIEVPLLKTILSANPKTFVIGNTETKEFLQQDGIASLTLNENELRVGSIVIRALPAPHEKILKQSPQNSAYVLNEKFLHPGDSLNECLYAWKGIDVLALPTMGSWMTVSRAGEFAIALRPKIVIPIHDGFAKAFYLKGHHESLRNYFQEYGVAYKMSADVEDSIKN